MRFGLVLLVIGIVLACLGFGNLYLSMQCSSEPVPHELSKLEAGEEVSNPHVAINEHLALYGDLVYYCTLPSGRDEDDVRPTDKIDYSYYGIISPEHPFVVQMNELMAAGPDLNIMGEAELPTVSNCAVLVKTKRFKTIGDLMQLDIISQEETLTGVVIGNANSLKKDERELILQSFPNIDMENTIVIEDGRCPTIAKDLGMAFGGVALAFVGLGILGIGFFRSKE